MTRSAQGTMEEPRTNVAQKRGLNRSILAQGWGQLREIRGVQGDPGPAGIFVPVAARNTSITCPQCGEVNAKSRRIQAVFQCVSLRPHGQRRRQRGRNHPAPRADAPWAGQTIASPPRRTRRLRGPPEAPMRAATAKGTEGSPPAPGRARRTSGRTR